MGRGIKLTPEVVEAFLAAVEEGTAGCEVSKRDDMPAWGTWCDWCDADKELAGKYARARERGVEHDEANADREARRQPTDSVDAQAQRTRIDWWKWRLSKRLPRDFGDRAAIDVSGKLSVADLIVQTAERKPEA